MSDLPRAALAAVDATLGSTTLLRKATVVMIGLPVCQCETLVIITPRQEVIVNNGSLLIGVVLVDDDHLDLYVYNL